MSLVCCGVSGCCVSSAGALADLGRLASGQSGSGLSGSSAGTCDSPSDSDVRGVSSAAGGFVLRGGGLFGGALSGCSFGSCTSLGSGVSGCGGIFGFTDPRSLGSEAARKESRASPNDTSAGTLRRLRFAGTNRAQQS